MKTICLRSQYFLIFLTGSAVCASAVEESPTVASKIVSIEQSLRTCVLEREKPEVVKEVATGARDMCIKLKEQVQQRLKLAQDKREAAEKELQKMRAAHAEAGDMQQRLNKLEGELFDTRRALEAKTSELGNLQGRLTQQHTTFAQAKTQFNQLQQQNTALKMQLQQAKQHSAAGPTSAGPAVAPHGTTALHGAA